MKKREKINFLTIIGLILILSGSSILIVDYVSKIQRDKTAEDYKQDFIDGINEDDIVKNPDLPLDVAGILEIDSIELSLPVSADGVFENLYDVLVAYSEAPTPPTVGNFAIAGHNGSCGELCKFKDLYKVQSGEEIRYIDRENTYVYKVYKNHIVDKADVWVLDPVEDKTTLTLITCQYPSWTRPERLIVHAELVEVIPNA